MAEDSRNRLTRADTFKVAGWLTTNWEKAIKLPATKVAEKIHKELKLPIAGSSVIAIAQDMGKGNPWAKSTGNKATDRPRFLAHQLRLLDMRVAAIERSFNLVVPDSMKPDLETLKDMEAGKNPEAAKYATVVPDDPEPLKQGVQGYED